MALSYLDDGVASTRAHNYCPLEAYEQYTITEKHHSDNARTAVHREWLDGFHISVDEARFGEHQVTMWLPMPELVAEPLSVSLSTDYEEKLAQLPARVRNAIRSTAGMFHFPQVEPDSLDILDDLLGD
jgi:hypothetical protein